MEFTSLQELYKRLTPALNSKERELKNMGYTYIKKDDIWEYLKDYKWIRSSNLNLYQMVDDIINIDYRTLEEYIKTKLENR
ncbi:MAG: hypothetical protein IJZ36_00795 [Bacilli bacterium]|nr:hypothetical protein [Bacilli bacterium]